jgi:hypothetical protein
MLSIQSETIVSVLFQSERRIDENNMAIIRTRRLSDGSYVELMPDGATRPSVSSTDWAKFDAMTDEEVTAAALSDPDAQPLTEAQLGRMKHGTCQRQ